MIINERDGVAALGEDLCQRIGEPRYKLWFAQNTKFHWETDCLLVGVPNHFFQEWLEATFGEAVRAAASAVTGQATTVRFVIDPELFQAARRVEADVREELSRKDNGKAPAPRAAPPSQDPDASAAAQFPMRRARRWRKLSSFVVGSCNRVACAAAVSVVEGLGQSANPLVLHGPVGTGKTHLLEGIYAGLRKQEPTARICFVAAEEFTNRFVQAVRFGKLAPFRKHFREVDALLVDDLQFLANKQATQEEFLHTFDALQAEGRQIVATCDVHPRLTDDFTPELADRLLGGGVWGLNTPDADTRLAILRAKAGAAQKLVPEEVLQLLAGELHGNVRLLEGALHSVQHFAHVAGRPVDLALAREALGELLRHSVRIVQLADVERAVCRVLKLEAAALQSKQRAWSVSHPRMVAMYLARRHTTASYSEIGEYFGARNHSTAVAAEKKVRRWLQTGEHLSLGERRLAVRDVVEMAENELAR